ncbi:MAG: protein phosphatase 2C domain-containing protein [Sedimenticola sp.]
MLIEVVSRTDKGRVRACNEDSLALFPGAGLVTLADGMGGYSAGEVASQLATEAVVAQLLNECDGELAITAGQMTAAVNSANRVVYDSSRQVPEWQGMGTTLLLGCFQEGRVIYGHVGDSRLYRFRADHLERLTRDHTVIQKMVDDGFFTSYKEARAAGVNASTLIRGLGIGVDLEVDVAVETVEEGDLFLFCSDGLSNMVSDAAIEKVIASSSGEMQETAAELLSLALENGGLDNISLVLARPEKRYMENAG